jgi:hypothetical protein
MDMSRFSLETPYRALAARAADAMWEYDRRIRAEITDPASPLYGAILDEFTGDLEIAPERFDAAWTRAEELFADAAAKAAKGNDHGM